MGLEENRECPSHQSQCSDLMEQFVQGEGECGPHDGKQSDHLRAQSQKTWDRLV